MNIFSSLFAVVSMVVSSLFFPTLSIPQVPSQIVQVPTPGKVTLGAFTPVQAPKTKLSGSGVSASATSITLQSLKLADASTTIAMTDLGTTGYGTLEPGTAREEQISFTGITQNGDGTATLTSVTRGLDFRGGTCTANTAFQKAHAGGTIFILSNTACFYSQELAALNSTSTITGRWSFPTSTASAARTGTGFVMDSTFPTSTFANIDYVNRVATSGVADASVTVAGKVEIATGAETASSTGAGGTSALLVPPASLFTSTSSASGKVPVVGPNNKLSQNFLNLGESYAWTEPHTFASSTRLSASSTIGVAGVTSTFRGGLDFTNASTTGLPFSSLIESTSTNQNNQGTAATTTLLTVSIPANTLIGTNVVVAEVYFSQLQQNGAGDNHQFRASYGGTNFATLNFQATTPETLTGKLEIYLVANGSSAQEGGITGIFSVQPSATGTVAIASNNVASIGNTVGTSAISGTSAQNLVLTVTNNFAAGGKGVTMSGYVVRKIIKE